MRRPLPAPALLALLWLGACAPEGPTGFVTFNLKPSSSCIVSPEATANLFIPIGQYDIAPGGSEGTADLGNCDAPYVVHLLVNSYLRPNADPMLGRSEPNILQIHSAEVKLMSIERQQIVFNRFGTELPNPFLVTTNNALFPAMGSAPTRAVAAVEAIPTAYAEQLDMFDGGQILAEIQIFGTTTGDVDIEFKPFVYPIEICYGCLQICARQIPMGMTEEDLVGDECNDNSGADGRVCIDRDC